MTSIIKIGVFSVRLVVRKRITLNYNKWELVVDLSGGRIVSLTKENCKILDTFERIDGKIGNTHVCVPNFGAEGVKNFGYTFHGPFRNNEWTLVKQLKNNLKICCEIDGLLVTQKFKIKDDFCQTVLVKNVSKKRKRVNVAIHNYWDTDKGWQGIKLNKIDITESFKTNPELKLKSLNILEIPGKNPIIWKVKNLKLAKLWTGFKEKDEIKIYDQKYVCIEPEREFEGFVERKDSWLSPKDSLILEQKIELKELWRGAIF